MTTVPVSSHAQSLFQQSTALRQELKEWEKAFATANGGRKARRDNIKKDAVISAKYKTYNRIRDQIAKGETSLTSPSRSTSRQHPLDFKSPMKRKRTPLDDVQPQADSQTPRKAQRYGPFSTPSKARSQLQAHEAPSTLQRLLSPGRGKAPSSLYVFKESIGPTPQRDGKVLGIFDLLSQSGGSVQSPTRGGVLTAPTKPVEEQIVQTPSRRKDGPDDVPEVLLDVPADEEITPRARRHSHTPASCGRRFLFSNFFKTPKAFKITPKKQPSQFLNEDIPCSAPPEPDEDHVTEPDPIATTNSADTPAFLRRHQPNHTMPSIDELCDLSPVAVRMPPKPFGRSLSSLVQGLRNMAEEEMDDDLDALRDMEAEELYGPRPVTRGKVLVEDSQADPTKKLQGLGWGDQGADLESIVEEEGENGAAITEEQQPTTKVWKKKGLKRQTKRTNMKPRAKLKSMPTHDEVDEEAVAETQVVAEIAPGLNDDEYNESVDDLTKDDDEPSKIRNKVTRKLKKNPKPSKDPAIAKTKSKNPLAHANFRALKIKNKNSKGKGRGRFGRRR